MSAPVARPERGFGYGRLTTPARATGATDFPEWEPWDWPAAMGSGLLLGGRF